MQNCISVVGYYTDQNEITFAGIKVDIARLAKELDFTGTSKSIPFYMPDDSPAPYAGFIKGIRLRTAPGLLQTTITSDYLVITGSPKAHQQLATALLQAARGAKPDNNHIENSVEIQYYPQHPFLAPTSWPLVVTIVGCGIEDNKVQIEQEATLDWAKVEKDILFDLPIDNELIYARNGGYTQYP